MARRGFSEFSKARWKGGENMKRYLLTLGIVAIVLLVVTVGASAAIQNSKHDLSLYAASTSTTEVCVYCHTPHTSATRATFLWNRNDPADPAYKLYGDTTTTSLAGKESLLCLSCHDGSVAINEVYNAPGTGLNSGKIAFDATKVAANANLQADTATPAGVTLAATAVTAIGAGKDLSNDHPVNVTYGGTGFNPATGGKVGSLPLYTDTVQCGSCHDPHKTDTSTFLRMSNASSALCLACHAK